MAYYRGDYYSYPRRAKGDYYRGHGRGDLKGFFKGLANVVTKATVGVPIFGPSTAPPAAVTAVTTPPFAGASALSPLPRGLGAGGNFPNAMAELPPPPGAMIPRLPSNPIAGPTTMMEPLNIKRTALIGHKRRRMNPTNVKALRRSVRRICSFGNVVKSMKRGIRQAANEVAPVHHQRALPPARRR